MREYMVCRQLGVCSTESPDCTVTCCQNATRACTCLAVLFLASHCTLACGRLWCGAGPGSLHADSLRNPSSGRLGLAKHVLEDYTLWWCSSGRREAVRREGRGKGYF